MLTMKSISRGLVLILGFELTFDRSDRRGNPVGDNNKSRGGESGDLKTKVLCRITGSVLQKLKVCTTFSLWSMRA